MGLNCIKVPHYKDTQFTKTISFNVPQKVKLPLSQHMGAPCNALVKKGDEVKVGQKIGDTDAFMSAPIHSSVSGKVTAISDYLLANGRTCKAIEIETDGLQTISEEVKPPVVSDKASFLTAVRESGCCGLGGAGFPTHVKLNFDKKKTPIDTLIINAAECEPYITADYREMIEFPEDIINGIELVLKYLEIKRCFIGIEDNKPQAIKKLRKMVEGNDHIGVKSLKASYPQGAEKVITYNTTGRIIGEGQLPSHQGVIVMNVSTVSFISKYMKTGMPLISKRLTVAGDLVKNPCNGFALLGTPTSQILNECNTDTENIKKLISGGPMMGMCLYDIDTPVVKTNNAVLALSEKAVVIKEQTNCIRCGRCIQACPLDLMPTGFEKAYDSRNVPMLKKLKVNLCMNCGSCSYVCPANRDLAEKNQLAKALIANK